MPKVTLIGSPQTQWMINGRFIPGGQEVELTDDEVLKHKDVVRGFKDEVKISKVEPKVKYTYEQLDSMSKNQQSEILKSFGVKKIPSTEKDRINAILEAQK